MRTGVSSAEQAAHLERLKACGRFPGCDFGSPDGLAKHLAYTVILDLLVKDYAAREARARDRRGIHQGAGATRDRRQGT
jgi:hypothetical protein